MNVFTRVLNWFERLLGIDLWLFETSEDPPEAPAKRRVYLVGDPDAPWSAAFLCPCNCGETVALSLIPDDDPSWIAAGRRGDRASLHPSIWRIRGCKSHFFIKEGKVIWAKESRPDHRI